MRYYLKDYPGGIDTLQSCSAHALAVLRNIMGWTTGSTLTPTALSCSHLDELLNAAYLPCLKLLSYEKEEEDMLTIFTHARVDLSVIEEAEKVFELQTPGEWPQRIDALNQAFSETMQNEESRARILQTYNESWPSNKGEEYKLHSDAPLWDLAWSKGELVATTAAAALAKAMERPDGDFWVGMLILPPKNINFVHGHTGETKEVKMAFFPYLSLEAMDEAKYNSETIPLPTMPRKVWTNIDCTDVGKTPDNSDKKTGGYLLGIFSNCTVAPTAAVTTLQATMIGSPTFFRMPVAATPKVGAPPSENDNSPEKTWCDCYCNIV